MRFTLLLDRGAQVNTAEPEVGHTALMWAVREQRRDREAPACARRIDRGRARASGAKPAARPPGAGGGSHGVGIVRGGVPPQGEQLPAPGGMTPLHFAARDGQLDAARLLVAAGADLNTPDPNGMTPLMMAITNGQIAGGAAARATRAQSQSGRLVRTHAAVGRGGDSQSRYATPPPPTTASTVRPRCDLITSLLDKGVDVNARVKEFPPQRRHMLGLGSLEWVDFTGQTPLIRAAQSADVALMRLLVSKGADPQLKTFNGTTVLMAAAGVNWVIGQTYSESPARWLEAVRLAIELGGDVNAVNAMGLAAVHGAANRGSDDIIELLAQEWRASRPQGQGRANADHLGGGRVPRHQLAGRQAIDDARLKKLTQAR